MSLLADLQNWYLDHDYPPTGNEFTPPAEEVSHKYGGSLRWGQEVKIVYKRDDSYVMVVDVEPATEMQDWGDYGDPDIFEVFPVEVTVTKYVRKSD